MDVQNFITAITLLKGITPCTRFVHMFPEIIFVIFKRSTKKWATRSVGTFITFFTTGSMYTSFFRMTFLNIFCSQYVLNSLTHSLTNASRTFSSKRALLGQVRLYCNYQRFLCSLTLLPGLFTFLRQTCYFYRKFIYVQEKSILITWWYSSRGDLGRLQQRACCNSASSLVPVQSASMRMVVLNSRCGLSAWVLFEDNRLRFRIFRGVFTQLSKFYRSRRVLYIWGFCCSMRFCYLQEKYLRVFRVHRFVVKFVMFYIYDIFVRV